MEDTGFEVWYEREHPRLLGSLYALAHDTEIAVDATDEAFARALASWSRVKAMQYPTAWLHRVGINLVSRQLQRRRRELEALPKLAVTRAVAVDNTEVWDAVAALPLRQRTAVVLRYIADLPEEAIAQAMGASRGTVASTLAAARDRLRNLLADQDTTEEAPYV